MVEKGTAASSHAVAAAANPTKMSKKQKAKEARNQRVANKKRKEREREEANQPRASTCEALSPKLSSRSRSGSENQVSQKKKAILVTNWKLKFHQRLEKTEEEQKQHYAQCKKTAKSHTSASSSKGMSESLTPKQKVPQIRGSRRQAVSLAAGDVQTKGWHEISQAEHRDLEKVENYVVMVERLPAGLKEAEMPQEMKEFLEKQVLDQLVRATSVIKAEKEKEEEPTHMLSGKGGCKAKQEPEHPEVSEEPKETSGRGQRQKSKQRQKKKTSTVEEFYIGDVVKGVG